MEWTIVISEVLFAGDVYSFAPASKIGEWDKIVSGHKPHPNEYIIVKGHKGGITYDTVQDIPKIQSKSLLIKKDLPAPPGEKSSLSFKIAWQQNKFLRYLDYINIKVIFVLSV